MNYGSKKTETKATNLKKEKIVRKGRLELTKIKIATDFDVCYDIIEDFKDYKNICILKDGGKYYHWLKNPTKDLDKGKGIIPITLHGDQIFKFEATFKVLFGNIDNATISANTQGKKYQFEKQSKNNLSEGEEVILTFEAKNKPYKNTIQYFSKFDLNFEIEDDNKCYSKTATFRLYLTWREPDWSNFSKNDTAPANFQKTTMQMQHYLYGARHRMIHETLLWLGCNNAKGQCNPKNEIEILDKIFNAFKNKKVIRKNETKWKNEGMGYWRNESSIRGSGLNDYRSLAPNCNALRFLLLTGEARCGEWNDFFRHIALCQRITLKSFSIYSEEAARERLGLEAAREIEAARKKSEAARKNNVDSKYSQWFLVGGPYGWNILDPKAPHEKAPGTIIPDGYKAQGNFCPLHCFQDHVFSIYKDSSGRMKYYDPSYGIKSTATYTNNNDLLNDYSTKALDGVLYFNKFPSTDTDHPDFHFMHDKHVKADLYNIPYHFRTERTNMQNHLYSRVR